MVRQDDGTQQILEISNLVAGYGGSPIIQSLSLALRPGEATCVLGPNGAGKSTLVGAISGVTPERSGEVLFQNENIVDEPPWRIVSMGISHIPQGRRIFGALTVIENLMMGAYTNPKNAADRLGPIYSVFPELREKSAALGSSLSGGQQQMLAIARGMMSSPDLLILDEPTLGLSPRYVQDLRQMLRGLLTRSGVTMLMVEQNVPLALELCDYAYVIQNGRVVVEGATSEFEPQDIADAFLASGR